MCTSQMDKLAKDAYKSQNVYMFKDKVPIGPLEMVDDVLVPAKCGKDSLNANTKVNAFVAQKKLKLSYKKCNKMHLEKGKSLIECKDLKVDDKTMNRSSQEKYLGSFGSHFSLN